MQKKQKVYIPGLSRKRNLKSIYYDKYTGMLDSASRMPTTPHCRLHRYIFIGQYFNRPTLSNKNIIEKLKTFGIKIKRVKYSIDNLPF